MCVCIRERVCVRERERESENTSEYNVIFKCECLNVWFLGIELNVQCQKKDRKTWEEWKGERDNKI